MKRWLKALLHLVVRPRARDGLSAVNTLPATGPQVAAAELIFQEILDSPGQHVSWALDFMTDNYYVFEANYHQLKEYLSGQKAPQALFGDLSTAANEVTRLLHNFLASATSLGDLTSTVVNGAFGSTPIRQLFHQRDARILKDDPLASFMRGLRNYMVHYRLPFPALDLGKRPEAATSRFALPELGFGLHRDELLRWPDWHKNAASYLHQSQTIIPIESVCDEYYDRTSAFHSWLHLAIREEFAAELTELDRLERQYDELMR